jgi:trigger factor
VKSPERVLLPKSPLRERFCGQEHAMSTDTPTTPDEAAETDDDHKMSLTVEIQDVGPCLKHVKVVVPRVDIDYFRDQALGELGDTAQVPGFRVGNVPRKLIERRFKDEISGEVKQKVLVISLEQLAEENDLDPINEPNLDVESMIIPEDGPFEYEFEVEVRPDFDLPDYGGLKIKRPVRETTDADVEAYKSRFLAQYGERKPTGGAVEADDYVTADIKMTWKNGTLAEWDDLAVCVKPTVRFQDAELNGFDKLMTGAKVGDEKSTELTVSIEAENIEMRGESVTATIKVKDVKRLETPELNKEFFERIQIEDVAELDSQIRDTLERQVTYEQRQSTREQVMEKITESASWELPESLVLRQTDNAMRREILEMQQAGFTKPQIQARENEMRQQAVSTTRQALKEHFVLDKIAEKEEIKVLPMDIDSEIMMMAMQSGESPRRVRARLQKSGMIENLEAQIRERKAVDVILQQADFTDVPMDAPEESTVEALPLAVCGLSSTSTPANVVAEETAG